MNCTICMSEKIQHDNMVWLDCCHSLCSDCYTKLTQNTCPYCRTIIKAKEPVDENKNIKNTNNLLRWQPSNIGVDSYIRNRKYVKNNKTRRKKKGFRSNKNRNPYERRTKKNKKARRMISFC